MSGPRPLAIETLTLAAQNIMDAADRFESILGHHADLIDPEAIQPLLEKLLDVHVDTAILIVGVSQQHLRTRQNSFEQGT